jgi:hypothetical protein
MFGTSLQPVCCIWLHSQESSSILINVLVDVSHWKCMCGCTPKLSEGDLCKQIEEKLLRSRKASSSTEVALGSIQTYLLYLMRKDKLFCAAPLSVKLTLTHKQCAARAAFVKEKIAAYCQTHFYSKYQTIHIDEKWFQNKETKQQAFVQKLL